MLSIAFIFAALVSLPQVHLAYASVSPSVCYDGYQGEQQQIADGLSNSGHKREAARIAAHLGDIALECYRRGLAGRGTAGDAHYFAVTNYSVATDIYTELRDAKSVQKYARLTILHAAQLRRDENPTQYNLAKLDVRTVRQDAAYLHVRL